jgi:hypothetical protein
MITEDTFYARLEELIQSALAAGVSDRRVRNALVSAGESVRPGPHPYRGLITLQQAAELLGFKHIDSVRRLIRNGDVQAHTADLRVRRAEVLAYIQKRQRPPHLRPLKLFTG